ncbi:MAG: AMIN domain-containing protein, partial [Candidatus Acidiferrales bacterium]
MRIMRSAWGRTTFVAASLILSSGALRASDAPVVHVKAVVKDGNVNLEAQANAPFEYTTYRPSQSLYVLDLSGVSAGDSAGARVVPSELVKSYRVSTYSAGSKPMVRLEVLVRAGVEPRIERTGNDELTLFVAANGNTDGPTTAAPAPTSAAPSVTPIAAKASDTKLTLPSSIQAIESVKLGQNGEQTEVNVVGSGKLSYHVIRLQNPDRLVLDFSGAHLKTSEKNIASNLDPVREIRLAQFSPEVSRVVIDLRSPAHYNINSTGNAVTVAFSPAAAATPARATDQPSNVTTTKSEIPAAIPAPAATPAPVEVAKQTTPAPVTAAVPAPVAALPAALTGSSAALATP